MSMITDIILSKIDELIAGIEQETQMIRSGKDWDLKTHVERKLKTVEEYERLLRLHKEGIRMAKQAERETLRTAGQRLDKVLKDNTRVIAAARDASLRLVSQIIDATNRAPASSRYTDTGRLAIDTTGPGRFHERV
jgi:exonuclease VII small subunit